MELDLWQLGLGKAIHRGTRLQGYPQRLTTPSQAESNEERAKAGRVWSASASKLVCHGCRCCVPAQASTHASC